MAYDNGQGRLFYETGTEPYTTKHGRTVLLKVWETQCVHPGCIKKFTIKTPASDAANKSKAFFMKHCPEHRLTKGEAWRAFLTKGQIKKRRVSDAEVADIRALAALGHKARDLALVYPVTERTLKAIISGYRR